MINIAEILKDCPSGMELDSTDYSGEVIFKQVIDSDAYPIKISVKYGNNYLKHSLTKYGQTYESQYNKCVIFPKGKTTWEGFQRPFKDGDVCTSKEKTVIMETVNHECYVSLEVAKLLKKAGFNWDTYSAYNKDGMFTDKNRSILTWNDFANYYSAPTLDVAQRWLRELKGIFICTTPEIKDYYATWNFYICNEQGLFYENEDCFLTYEEAQEMGIKKALEMILEKGE